MRLRAAGAVLFFSCICLWAQNNASNSVVPTLIPFSGTASDMSGKPPSGVVGVTFAFYKDEQGGVPLWLETQNVQLDVSGHYTVSLGATKSAGLPLDLFASGEARWLGIQPEGQQKQPRVLLLAVPYALKAADAATIGGLPPSAFVLVPPTSRDLSLVPAVASTLPSSASPTAGTLPASAITGSGTANYVPLWTGSSTSTTIGNSVLYQSGSGATAKVGINTTTPSTTLDLNGAGTIRGILSLQSTGTATTVAGKNSQPLSLTASTFNSTTSNAVGQYFNFQVEPVGNNTATPSGTLNLLFGAGGSKPVETGFSINSNGNVGIGTTTPTSRLTIQDSSPGVHLLSSDPTGGIAVFDTSPGGFTRILAGGAAQKSRLHQAMYPTQA